MQGSDVTLLASDVTSPTTTTTATTFPSRSVSEYQQANLIINATVIVLLIRIVAYTSACSAQQ
jgi:hypothetical protein